MPQVIENSAFCIYIDQLARKNRHAIEYIRSTLMTQRTFVLIVVDRDTGEFT